MTYDLILKNGCVVTPAGRQEVDVAVKDGKIAGIGKFDAAEAKQVEDCTGLFVLPGLIDTQVHFREPGLTHKEDFEHGLRAAAAGGVTGVFEMPNTNPLTTTPEAVEDKLDRASKCPAVDYAFYLGGTAENAKDLKDWENLPGICGIKIFMGSSTGNLLSATDEEVDAILASGRRVLASHCEDEEMLKRNKETILKDSDDVAMHPVWRSPEQCFSATKRLIRLARKNGRRVHVLHITTAEEMEFLKDHRDIASVEVLANHLTLHAPDCYEELGARAQQNPPIREKHHQDALWKAIDEGLVDIVASDHAAHTLEEKELPYPKSPSGTPGVQSIVPIMLNHVNEGRLTLERLVDLMAEGPHRIHQIAGKGRISLGFDADFTIVDMNKEHTFTNEEQHSKSGWTPYDGVTIKGFPVRTIVRGTIVMKDGEILEKNTGKPIRFRESLGN